MTTKTSSQQTGIVVATNLTAGPSGGMQLNHAEGIVVTTNLQAGPSGGFSINHAEGIVVTTNLQAGPSGGFQLNHAEGIVAPEPGVRVTSGVVAGGKKIFIGGMS